MKVSKTVFVLRRNCKLKLASDAFCYSFFNNLANTSYLFQIFQAFSA